MIRREERNSEKICHIKEKAMESEREREGERERVREKEMHFVEFLQNGWPGTEV